MIAQHIIAARIQALQDAQLFVNTNMRHELHVYIETLQKCLNQEPDERLSYYEAILFAKKKFGFSQGYEVDMEIRIDAYEYVLEIEHDKDDELMDVDFFTKFDDTLQAIVEQSDGKLTIDKQAYNNFKNQVLNNEKYETKITDYGVSKIRELTEGNTPICLTQGLDDVIDKIDEIDLADIPSYEKEEKVAYTEYPEDTCEETSEDCVACCEENYPDECVEPGCCEECVPEGPEDIPFPEENDNPLGLARCMECGTLFDATSKDMLDNCATSNERRCRKCKRVIRRIQLKAQVKD